MPYSEHHHPRNDSVESESPQHEDFPLGPAWDLQPVHLEKLVNPNSTPTDCPESWLNSALPLPSIPTTSPTGDLTLPSPIDVLSEPEKDQQRNDEYCSERPLAGPISVMEGLKRAMLIGRTTLNMLRFINTAKRITGDFSLSNEHQISEPYKKLPLMKFLPKGELGGILYDVSGATFGRPLAVRLSAEALTVVSVADYFLDEVGLTENQQIAIIDGMLCTLKTGKIKKTAFAQVNQTLDRCCGLHEEFSRAPAGSLFFNQFERLAGAAIQQISGTPNLHDAVELGSATIGVSAIIPYCFQPDLPLHYLTAAKHFGAYVQLVDDIQDVHHDKERGLKTWLTLASDPYVRNTEGLHEAAKHFRSCLSLLNEKEGRYFRVLSTLGKLKWNLGYLKND